MKKVVKIDKLILGENILKNLINSKNKILIITVSIFLAVALLFGIGYAFFVQGIGPFSNTDLEVVSKVAEKASFKSGDPISLYADNENFHEYAGSITEETISSAYLIASTDTGTATLDYQVYVDITANTFEYTQNEDTPELLLTVIDPDGNEVTWIREHTHKTVTDAYTGETITGFDITNFSGLIAVKEDYNISTTSTTTGTTQEWTIKLTFVNLDANQIDNQGKTIEANLILGEDKLDLGLTTSQIASTILTNNGGIDEIVAKATPNFAVVATTNEGMFAAPDDYGTSYYFRGAVDNNWVEFAGYYWRIIRVNGDNSVRMIYSGVIPPTESQSVVKTGNDTQIGTASTDFGVYVSTKADFTSVVNDNFYQGIDTYASWDTKLIDYENYLQDSIFCLDNRPAVNDNNSGWVLERIAVDRMYTNQPILTCENETGKLTVNDTINGTGTLTYPIGMISYDEMHMAGGKLSTTNNKFYLHTNLNYFTITPMLRNGTSSSNYTYYIVGNGDWSASALDMMTHYLMYSGGAYVEQGLRPVINLKGDTLTSGNGTWNNPYFVHTN